MKVLFLLLLIRKGEAFFECECEGNFPYKGITDYYWKCSRNGPGYKAEATPCLQFTCFDASIAKCRQGQCNPSQESPSCPTQAPPPPDCSGYRYPEIECKGLGNHPDPTNMRSYYICSMTPCGWEAKKEYCPTNTCYDEWYFECSKEYCAKPPPSTPPPPDCSGYRKPEIDCKRVGRNLDPTNIRSYYVCMMISCGWEAKKEYCPSNTCYDDFFLDCSKDYCRNHPPPPPPPPPSSPPPPGDCSGYRNPEIFCKRDGNHPDSRDNRSYYICTYTSCGWETRKEQCSRDTCYDDSIRTCSRNYCNAPPPPSTPPPPPPPPGDCSGYRNPEIFCMREGNHRDPKNPRSYYFCTLTKCGWETRKESCARDTCYDDAIKTCSENSCYAPPPPPPGDCSGYRNPEIYCKRDGNHPDPKNIRSYYVCTLTNCGWETKKEYCPSGTCYSDSNDFCSRNYCPPPPTTRRPPWK